MKTSWYLPPCSLASPGKTSSLRRKVGDLIVLMMSHVKSHAHGPRLQSKMKVDGSIPWIHEIQIGKGGRFRSEAYLRMTHENKRGETARLEICSTFSTLLWIQLNKIGNYMKPPSVKKCHRQKIMKLCGWERRHRFQAHLQRPQVFLHVSPILVLLLRQLLGICCT